MPYNHTNAVRQRKSRSTCSCGAVVEEAAKHNRNLNLLVWHDNQETFTSKFVGLQLIVHRWYAGAASKKE